MARSHTCTHRASERERDRDRETEKERDRERERGSQPAKQIINKVSEIN